METTVLLKGDALQSWQEKKKLVRKEISLAVQIYFFVTLSSTKFPMSSQ